MVFSDIRLKRTLQDILFPSPKDGMGPRSLAYLRLVLADKSNSVLFATFPKSGWNWSGDILTYCLYASFKDDDYNVTFSHDGGHLRERMKRPLKITCAADSRARHMRKVCEFFPEIDIDYIFHVHEHWKYSPLWGLDNARVVFITRNIPTTLYSNFKTKQQVEHHESFESFLRSGILERVINYYNSWGDFRVNKKESHCKIIKYEDMRTDPMSAFSEMYQFVFKKSVEKEILEKALLFYSFENQKKREFMFNNDEDKHFHFQGRLDYRDLIGEECLNRINMRLKKELRHTFGYEYTTS